MSILTFVWQQGRKLTSGTMNGKSFTYTYDPNGMRYKKKVGNVTTNFYYNGTQLLMEDRGGGADRIYYIYGASGISGMILQEGYAQYTYYFDKNILGDIIAIRNQQGDIIALYTYDAWGNHKVLKASGTTDTNQSSIGNINPFRYRGYYYDTETGFYYLQTRYYDPTICRFINADNYELVADLASSLQLNMYAYCGNNPIMLTDETGEFGILATILISVVAGALISGGGEIAKQVYNHGDWNWDITSYDWWSVGAETLKGGAIGFAFGLGGVAGGMVTGSFATIGGMTLGQSIGALFGTAAFTSFLAGMGGYALEEHGNVNFGKAISRGFGHMGKGIVAFMTGGMMVSAGVWNVGIRARNKYNFILRAIAKGVVNFIPNNFFDKAF